MNDWDHINSLIPINALRADNLRRLSAHAQVESVVENHVLFERGDTGPQTLYLLAGEVTLTPATGAPRTIAGGSEDARYPLAQQIPRRHTAVAITAATIARVDTAWLDHALTIDQTGASAAAEAGTANVDWVFRMIQHPALDKVPAGRLMALFEQLVPVEVKAGSVIIGQGDPGDYYFIIKSGQARVERTWEDGRVATLAQLGVGDSFGEEALISAAPRNASVIATTDGTQMRLSKRDFDRLLRAPLVKLVSLPEAQEMASLGTGLIDVRTEDEFLRGAIKGAVNLPLYLLRLKAGQLSAKRKYITYCDTGDRSAAAAFLLAQRGFEVFVLAGGLNAVSRG